MIIPIIIISLFTDERNGFLQNSCNRNNVTIIVIHNTNNSNNRNDSKWSNDDDNDNNTSIAERSTHDDSRKLRGGQCSDLRPAVDSRMNRLWSTITLFYVVRSRGARLCTSWSSPKISYFTFFTFFVTSSEGCSCLLRVTSAQMSWPPICAVSKRRGNER